jgi:hypothetical protein
MEVEQPYQVESIILATQSCFPYITAENFADVFKLKPDQIANNLVRTSENTIRDFLILLYWLKHASSIRCIVALFGLKKSRVSVIICAQLQFWSERAKHIISLSDAEIDSSFFLPNCIGSVDGTEFHINAWVADSYSGKQGCVLLFHLIIYYLFIYLIVITTFYL